MAYEETQSVIINEDTDSPISVSLLRDVTGDKIDIRYMYRDNGELRHTKRGIRMSIDAARRVLKEALMMLPASPSDKETNG